MAGLQKSYYGGPTQGYQWAVVLGRNNSFKSHPSPPPPPAAAAGAAVYPSTPPQLCHRTTLDWHPTLTVHTADGGAGCLRTEESHNKALTLICSI